MDGRIAVLGRFTGTLQFPNATVTSASDAMVIRTTSVLGIRTRAADDPSDPRRR
jgi:hypothetical protein